MEARTMEDRYAALRTRAERAAVRDYRAWIGGMVEAFWSRVEDMRGGVGSPCSGCRGRLDAGMVVLRVWCAPLAPRAYCEACAVSMADGTR